MVTIAEAQASAEQSRQSISEARGNIATETTSIASARSTLTQQQKSLEQARAIPKSQLYAQRGIAAVQARRETSPLCSRHSHRPRSLHMGD